MIRLPAQSGSFKFECSSLQAQLFNNIRLVAWDLLFSAIGNPARKELIINFAKTFTEEKFVQFQLIAY
jgi:hypothetical protein